MKATGRYFSNLWNQLTAAGQNWGVYEELVPSTCYAPRSRGVTTPSKDRYGNGHNPGITFANIYTSPQCQSVKPLTQMPTTLPAVSWVTPSYCNDMHGVKNDPTYPTNCQAGIQALVTRGDSWLQNHVEQWRAEGAIVIITFDEGSSATGGGGRVFTVEVGPGITPTTVATSYNHYSLLAGLEDKFGVPRLNNAIGAPPLPIG